jgi:hypothetical protein
MVSAPSYPNGRRSVSATEMKKFVLLAAIGLLLCACGSLGMGGSTNPSPTPTLGVTENEHTATVRVGQKLEVALHAANGMSNWTHPVSSDPSILAPTVDPAATAAIGVTLAMFVGTKPGTVEVTSNASPRCPPNAACPMYLAVYSLKVTVTATQ